jgi:hypothetical protein
MIPNKKRTEKCICVEEKRKKDLLLFDGLPGVVHDALDLFDAEHLVDLVERLVSRPQAVEHLHFDLRELEVVHQSLQVVQRAVRASQQLLLQPLLPQQQLRPAATINGTACNNRQAERKTLTLFGRRRAVCARAADRAPNSAPRDAGTASLCPAAASVAATITSI